MNPESAKNISFKMIDIGANLSDGMFDGVYHGKKSHQNDIEQVLDRAHLMGVEKIILTGTDLEESKASLEIIERFKDSKTELFTTVGVHPTRCQEFLNYSSPEAYEQELRKLIKDNPQKIVAIGECGLDYARLEFCPKEIQMKYFLKQLEIAHDIQLPLFFHNRDTQGDFLDILFECCFEINLLFFNSAGSFYK